MPEHESGRAGGSAPRAPRNESAPLGLRDVGSGRRGGEGIQPEFATQVRIPGVMLFVAAWTGMSVAMMLPTSLPVLTTLHTFASDRADRWLLLSLAALGYLAAWTAVGVFVGPVSIGLQGARAFPVGPGLLDRAVAPALLLVAAGLACLALGSIQADTSAMDQRWSEREVAASGSAR